jgi:DNA-directed RNA polymerase specialized sigma24 family protein
VQTATYSVPKRDGKLAVRERSDRELLACFLNDRDDAAFETLVVRYTSMVLAVCWYVLRHQYDAEDAFQQTMLLLMRKAASLCDKQNLGRWLKAATYRVALNVGTRKRWRKKRESRVRVSNNNLKKSRPVRRRAGITIV